MIEQDIEETLVVFRVWYHTEVGAYGQVIALFPGIPEPFGCTSYEHVGQHGGADYNGVIARTRPALPSEYADLKRELEGLGYRLKVRQRWNRRGGGT